VDPTPVSEALHEDPFQPVDGAALLIELLGQALSMQFEVTPNDRGVVRPQDAPYLVERHPLSHERGADVVERLTRGLHRAPPIRS
jgi:hypothetical protein